MRRPFREAAKFAAVVGLLVALGPVSSLWAATPDALFTVTQPVGVVATQTEVLVSQPYCVNDSQTGVLSPPVWQILKFDNAGTQTTFATLPADPNYGVAGTLSNCAEPYLAISTGLGGFAAGHVFATKGGNIYEFDGTGTLVRTLASIPSLEVANPHTGIAFDNVGSFGNKLLVVGTDASNKGEIWSVDASGATTLLTTQTEASCSNSAGVACFETPDVAPSTGAIATAGFGGFLFTPMPGNSGSTFDIGDLSPALSFNLVTGAAGSSLAVPEAVHFVPVSGGCGFTFKNGNTYEFFNNSFSTTSNGLGGSSPGNTVFGYQSSVFAGLDKQLLITTEGATGVTTSADTSSVSVLDPAIYNAEGSNFITCAASVCPSNPPVCSGATASNPNLWPPNHKFVDENILGVTGGAGGVTITITGITQDEPTEGLGSGNTCPDGKGVGTSTADVRAERDGEPGFDGRVYHIGFQATDSNGQSCTGTVPVCVPHDQGAHKTCVDTGLVFDSTKCP